MKYIVSLLFLFFFVSDSSSQISYQPLYTDATFDSADVDVSLAVGSIPGIAGVASGLASYSIPIAIPPSTNNIAAKMSFSYSSVAGNGILGQGWSVSGLSTISRIGSNMYFDGQVTAVLQKIPNDNLEHDRFMLDGKRLIKTAGAYGYESIFGFEFENFSEIRQHGYLNGPDWFEYESKDGIVMEYGNTSDSKVLSLDGDVLYWKLSKIRYKDGNFIEYVYNDAHNISEVRFTGNSLSGLTPYNSIRFNYATRNDVNTMFVAGQSIPLANLLESVVVDVDNQLFKQYSLSYGFNGSTSFLTKITETGSDGAILNPTIFKYGDKPSSFTPASVSAAVGSSPFPTGGYDFRPADFNGDGLSDVLAYKRVIGANYELFYDEVLFWRNESNNQFSLIKTIAFPNYIMPWGSSDFHRTKTQVLDFDGDGSDDIAFVEVARIGAIPQHLDKVTVYTKLDSPNETVKEFDVAALGMNNIEVESDYAFLPGDFNGDGKTEIFFHTHSPNGNPAYLLLGENGFVTVNPNYYVDNNPVYKMHYTDELKYDVIDFDGDGKSELIARSGTEINETRVYTLKPDWNTFEFLSVSHEIKGWDLIYPGDFNGDGKTDILFRDNTYQNPSDNNRDWKIATSTGENFTINAFSFSENPNINEHYFLDQIIIADYNGDGKSDIVHGWQGTQELDIYYSKGNSFAPSTHHNFSASSVSYFNDPIRFSFDGNGDGNAEIFYRNIVGGDVITLGFNVNGTDYLLEKIKNGFGAKTEFEYKWMTDPAVYHTVSGSLTYPLQNIKGDPLPLVFKYRTDAGPGHFPIEMEYLYEGGIIHRTGKGFLGFGKIQSWSNNINNAGDDLKTVYEYELSPVSFVNKLEIETQYNPTNQSLALSKSIYHNTELEVSSGSKRFLHKVERIESYDYLASQFIDTRNLDYDVFGNVKKEQVRKGIINNSGQEIETIETITTDVTYVAKGTIVLTNGVHVPSKPSVTTINIKRDEDPNTYTEKTKNEYNAIGQVKKTISRYDSPIATTTEYWYDDFGSNVGNVERIETRNLAGLLLKSKKMEYDAKGRNVMHEWNSLNQQRDYDSYNIWGQPKEMTGVDGLKTYSEYDGFGRVSLTKYNYNTVGEYSVSTTYLWTTDVGSRYLTKVEHPAAPDEWIYYDRLGRNTKTLTEGFDDKWITQETSYDYLGRVHEEKAPVKDGETALITTYTYDSYMRPESSSNILGTTTNDYSYANGQLTFEVTSPDGKKASKVVDVSGKVVQSKDNNNDLLDFTYYSHGKVNAVKKGQVTLVSNSYDSYARQLEQIDQNAGTTSYTYDELDRLMTQTNANGEIHSFTYDILDRIETKTIPEGVNIYEYYPAGSGASTNQLQKITGFAGNITEYTYDDYGFGETKTQIIDGNTFLTAFDYDGYGSLNKLTYPSELELNYDYDSNGYLKTIKDNNNVHQLFRNIGMNGYNQYTTFETGSGIIHVDEYKYGVPQKYKATRNGNVIQDLTMIWEDETGDRSGNLRERIDAVKSKSESFTYDNLDRLRHATVNGGTPQNVQYKSDGNIFLKSDAGFYSYDGPRPNAVTKITDFVGSIQSISHETQQVSYNSFLQPSKIREIVDGNMHELDYVYDSDGQRLKSTLAVAGKTNIKYYLGDGCEKTGLQYDHYVFVGGRMIALIKRIGTTNAQTELYTLTDHLGSIVTVTNKYGSTLYEQNFDAWGRKRNPDTWTYENIPATYNLWVTSNRGYTGHEYLPGFDLINMNGRLYDPVVGRMLSVDNNINNTYSSLGYDRYSYAFNNPLKYTDPDGETPIHLIAALVGGTLNVINQALSGNVTSLKEGLAYFGTGAISGAMAVTPGMQIQAGAFLATSNKVVQIATGKFKPPNSIGDVAMFALDVVGDFAAPAASAKIAAKLPSMLNSAKNALMSGWRSTASGGEKMILRSKKSIIDEFKMTVEEVGKMTDKALDRALLATNDLRVSAKRIVSGGKSFRQYKRIYWSTRVKRSLPPKIDPISGKHWKQYTELHHRFVPQRAKWAPDWLKNNRINLKEVSSLRHAQIDPYRARFAPRWAKEQFNLIWR